RGTAVVEAFAHRLQVRLDLLKRGRLAADHESQGPALCAWGRTGARGVEIFNPFGGEGFADLAALAGTDGTGVGHDRGGFRAFDHAIRTDEHRLGHRRIADT